MNNISDKEVKEVNDNLRVLNKRLGSLWLSLGKGLLIGFGSAVGAGLAIILIGWFLNVIGVIPAFQKQANDWRTIFLQAQNQNNKTFISTDDTPATE